MTPPPPPDRPTRSRDIAGLVPLILDQIIAASLTVTLARRLNLAEFETYVVAAAASC